MLLAQLGANKHVKKGDDTVENSKAWYDFYDLVLQNLGFIKTENIQFNEFEIKDVHVKMDEVAMDVLQGVMSSNDEVTALKGTLEQFSEKRDSSQAMTIFDNQCRKGSHFDFRLNPCTVSTSGDIVMTIGAFYFTTKDKVDKKFLFFDYSKKDTKIYKGTQHCVFNKEQYGRVRDAVVKKLGVKIRTEIVDI